MTLSVGLRRWWWQKVRRYAYEVCQDCGRPVAATAFGITRWPAEGLVPVTYWFADNELWNAVMGSELGVLCPRCFTGRAEGAGHAVGWRCGRVGEVEQ